jgi:hypothetical protein
VMTPRLPLASHPVENPGPSDTSALGLTLLAGLPPRPYPYRVRNLMKNVMALAAVLLAAPVHADQWDAVATKDAWTEWRSVSYKVSGAEQKRLAFYGILKASQTEPDYKSDKPGYDFSLPLFELTPLDLTTAEKAKNTAKFQTKATPFRIYFKTDYKANPPEVLCVGAPCPEGTISDTTIAYLDKITGIKKTAKKEKVIALPPAEKPAGSAYKEPPKPVGLSDFEKAAYEHLLVSPAPAYAACADAKNFDACRATLGTTLAGYKAPEGADLTAAERSYLKTRLGAEDAKFQAALDWNKSLGTAKYSAFVAKYRKAVADEAAAYAKAADKSGYAPATGTSVTELAKAEPTPLTGIEADIARGYPKEDANTVKFRELLFKLASANDGGKPPKPVNNLADRIAAAAKAKDPTAFMAIQKAVMEDVQAYLEAKDPAKYPSKYGLQKAGIDEKMMLGALCTSNMKGAGADPHKGQKKTKEMDKLKASADGGTAGVMDGTALMGVDVSNPSSPIYGKCEKFNSEKIVDQQQNLTNGGPNSLKTDPVPPVVDGKEEKDKEKQKQANNGKALDETGDPGPSKVGDHVRAGATLGLGFGIISLVALMAGPIGWAYVAASTAVGFGIGYGLDSLVNK